jgi:hypothetical protein
MVDRSRFASIQDTKLETANSGNLTRITLRGLRTTVNFTFNLFSIFFTALMVDFFSRHFLTVTLRGGVLSRHLEST